MSIHVNDAGTWRQINELRINDSGTWRLIQEVYVNDLGTWRLVFQYFSAAMSPTAINTSSNPSGSAFCIATGGSGSFTYSWVRISGDTRITANTPTTIGTTFTRTGFAIGEIASAVFQCTITDTVTGLTTSATLNVTLERPDLGGP